MKRKNRFKSLIFFLSPGVKAGGILILVEVQHMTNEELVIYIKDNPADIRAKEQLYYQLERYIKLFIDRNFTCERDKEDLQQESYFAMCKALNDYDITKGKFITHFNWKLKSHLQRYIINNTHIIRLSSHQQEQLNKYLSVKYRLELAEGREPTQKEIAAAMGVSVGQIRKIKEYGLRELTDSTDRILSSDDNSLSLLDTIADDTDIEQNTIEEISKEELKRDLWECVDSLLNKRQSYILRGIYKDGKKQIEISKEIGVNNSYVGELKHQALKKLKNSASVRNKLLPYIDFQIIESRAMHGVGVGIFNRTWTSATERVALKNIECIEMYIDDEANRLLSKT